MKIKAAFLAMALIGGFHSPSASASVQPIVESFKFTPEDIEIVGSSTVVTFELVVTHPFGIEDNKTELTLRNSRNDSLTTILTRTDSPIDAKKIKVTFAGSIEIPRDVATGAYSISATEIRNNSDAGYRYSTGTIEPSKYRNILGAESHLIVKRFGFADIDYETFNGPTFDQTVGAAFNDTSKYSPGKQPIWKVGESLDPNNYFELKVPSLSFFTTSNSPTICSSDGKILKFLSEGTCSYTISTPRTSIYKSKSYTRTATITASRPKVALVVEKISDQKSSDLPKSLQLNWVYSAASGFILPKSETPTVCIAIGYVVQILSGGTCTLSYVSPETPTYRASDVYLQTFEIVRTPQTLEFAPSSSVDVKSKTLTLSASASSGAAVAFTAEPAANCNVTGTTLNLLKAGNCVVTAQQAGTTTIAPISKTVTISITGKAARELRMISCVKGAKKVSVTKVKPKCPKGYSRVR